MDSIRYNMTEEDMKSAFKLKWLKDKGKFNNTLFDSNYIFDTSKQFNKFTLQQLCFIYEIKYSPYDNKNNLIKLLFDDFSF